MIANRAVTKSIRRPVLGPKPVTSIITVRMLLDIHRRGKAAAERDGVSFNLWCERALMAAVEAAEQAAANAEATGSAASENFPSTESDCPQEVTQLLA